VTQRSPSLDTALADIDSGTPRRVSRIVVSREWWDALSEHERDAYHKRCTDRGIELTADDRISRHFVEIIDGGEPPLSSERRV
jgi:hypothetical protein